MTGVGRFSEGTTALTVKALVAEAARLGTLTFRANGSGGIVYDFQRQIGTHGDGSLATKL
jgi:hypothetical protein